MTPLSEAEATRFWHYVDRGAPDACWLWRGGVSRSGYGGFWLRGRTEGAHCVAFALGGGVLPSGKVVRHDCDTPLCCNPAHLLLGTYRQNTADMWRRGRAQRGERSPSAKLTDAQVAELRAQRASGVPLKALAVRYGVTESRVSQLALGRFRALPPCATGRGCAWWW